MLWIREDCFAFVKNRIAAAINFIINKVDREKLLCNRLIGWNSHVD